MSAFMYSILLGLVVIWPLLLAIPALYASLPWPRHLAILPAIFLLIVPEETSLVMPQMLLGTGFSIDGEIRWILLMSVAVWLMAATVMQSWKYKVTINRATPFFLITLAGNLGAVLASDLVGFFCFSTLMGYGFYGLILQRCNDGLRRVGRLYLMLLVIADLLLFEALLLAASTTGDLRFTLVREALTVSTSSQLYVWMVLIGFTLKAGIWPAHLWLTATFRSASLLTTLLLGGVPLAMGLLGMMRWLPLGEHAFSSPGMIMQIMGIVSILYALTRIVMNRSMKIFPAWVSVALSGSFLVALGAGLNNPAIWNQYMHFIHPAIATLGIFLAVLTFTINRLYDMRTTSETTVKQPGILRLLTGQWLSVIQSWAADKSIGIQSRCYIPTLKALMRQQHAPDWQKPWGNTATWSIRITIFVLFILILAWLAG